MNKRCATTIRDLALKAITELTAILAAAQDHGGERELRELSRGVGSAIGLIEGEILADIYSQYPDLDDLR